MRIGVFVCHCGMNIAGTVDVEALLDFARKLPDVVVARDSLFMCSETGYRVVEEECRRNALEGLVFAACSPRMHLTTFRRYAVDCGLNPFLVEVANIREQAAWVVDVTPAATERAKNLIAAALIRLIHNTPLQPIHLPLKPSVLVIGGGIAGIEAALTLAMGGVDVHLVERAPAIGGNMAKLDRVFPTLDCAASILTPKTSAVINHPRIRLYTMAEVVNFEGAPGNFVVTIRRRPRYVDEARCIGCGLCVSKCPVEVSDAFNEGLSETKAIHFLFERAIPRVPFIEEAACLKLTRNSCGDCATVCPKNAVDFNDKGEEFQVEVGFVLVAVGYRLLDVGEMRHYGWRRYRAVLTSLQFERMLSSDGPTKGKILIPGTNKVPRSVAILHCVGARDRLNAPYCSRICCMYALKFATLIRQRCAPQTIVYNFYIDMRCYGKGYEEFYRRAAETGVKFIRGKPVSVITPEKSHIPSLPPEALVVVAEDTLSKRLMHIPVDMVILCPAMLPSDGLYSLARMLRLSLSPDGFLMERHVKLDPTRSTTEAIHIAGCCHGPKEIQETVTEANSAAAGMLAKIKKGFIEKEPFVASVDESLCIGCGVCVDVCPYSAREMRGNVAVVVEGSCEGCASCGVACPSGATTITNFTRTALTEAASIATLGKTADV